jgi:uncharacterized protein
MMAFVPLCIGSANAASFRCNQQLPADLRTICNDPHLNYLDTEAGGLYNHLSQQMTPVGRNALKEERIGFLRERGACSTDRACLARVYNDQISRLRSMGAPTTAPMRSTSPGY